MRLAGKVAIISGAASGMGTATARMFAREGAKVVIADMLEHEGRQVAQAIGAAARFEPLDVTKEDDWAAVVAATTKHFGKLDVLINNAGISGSAEQDFYSTEAWHRIIACGRGDGGPGRGMGRVDVLVANEGGVGATRHLTVRSRPPLRPRAATNIADRVGAAGPCSQRADAAR
jgi:NADPH:quinone reductase-like Zn-dependent oxidoreductase